MTFQSATLTTSEAVQVDIAGPSQVEVSGTFGTILLTSSTGLVTERTITGAATFMSEMEDMLFTLSAGAGPVVVGVKPLSGNSTPKTFTMVVT